MTDEQRRTAECGRAGAWRRMRPRFALSLLAALALAALPMSAQDERTGTANATAKERDANEILNPKETVSAFLAAARKGDANEAAKLFDFAILRDDDGEDSAPEILRICARAHWLLQADQARAKKRWSEAIRHLRRLDPALPNPKRLAKASKAERAKIFRSAENAIDNALPGALFSLRTLGWSLKLAPSDAVMEGETTARVALLPNLSDGGRNLILTREDASKPWRISGACAAQGAIPKASRREIECARRLTKQRFEEESPEWRALQFFRAAGVGSFSACPFLVHPEAFQYRNGITGLAFQRSDMTPFFETIELRNKAAFVEQMLARSGKTNPELVDFLKKNADGRIFDYLPSAWMREFQTDFLRIAETMEPLPAESRRWNDGAELVFDAYDARRRVRVKVSYGRQHRSPLFVTRIEIDPAAPLKPEELAEKEKALNRKWDPVPESRRDKGMTRNLCDSSGPYAGIFDEGLERKAKEQDWTALVDRQGLELAREEDPHVSLDAYRMFAHPRIRWYKELDRMVFNVPGEYAYDQRFNEFPQPPYEPLPKDVAPLLDQGADIVRYGNSRLALILRKDLENFRVLMLQSKAETLTRLLLIRGLDCYSRLYWFNGRNAPKTNKRERVAEATTDWLKSAKIPKDRMDAVVEFVNDFCAEDEREMESAIALLRKQKAPAWAIDCLSGLAELRAAWKARGSTEPGKVSDRKEKLFKSHMEAAARHLRKARKANPKSMRVHAALLSRALGIGSAKEAEASFRAAVALSPDDSEVFDLYLETLRSKRGGDADLILPLLSEAMKQDETASDLPRKAFRKLEDLIENERPEFASRNLYRSEVAQSCADRLNRLIRNMGLSGTDRFSRTAFLIASMRYVEARHHTRYHMIAESDEERLKRWILDYAEAEVFPLIPARRSSKVPLRRFASFPARSEWNWKRSSATSSTDASPPKRRANDCSLSQTTSTSRNRRSCATAFFPAPHIGPSEKAPPTSGWTDSWSETRRKPPPGTATRNC